MISFFEIWASSKYLFPKTREKFFSLITLFSFFGISLGVATLIIVGSAIMHDHDDEHDGEYHEYMEHIIERLESIEERLD